MHAVGKGTRLVDLRGMLVPVRADGQAIVIEFPSDGAKKAVCIFSSVETLLRGLKPEEFSGVAIIADPQEFLISVPPGLLVVVDCYHDDQGNARFTAVLRD